MAEDTDQPVKDLYNLVYDRHVLRYAWHEVSGKKGARIAGVDRRSINWIRKNIGWKQFLSELAHDLKHGTYAPLPGRQLICAGRAVCMRTIKDRVVETAVRIVLSPLFEPSFHGNAFAYRKGTSAADAIRLLRYRGAQCNTFVRADIKSCFDTMSHRVVIRRLRTKVRDRRLLRLITQLLRAVASSPGRGIGQGTMLAPLISNIVLTELDQLFPRGLGIVEMVVGTEPESAARAIPIPLRPPTRRSSGRLTGLPVLYVRYSDDLIVLTTGGQAQAELLLALIEATVHNLGMRLNDKTQIGDVDDGVDFLGVNLRRTRPQAQRLSVAVSDHNIARMKAILLEALDGDPSVEEVRQLVRSLRWSLDSYRHMGANTSEAVTALAGLSGSFR